MSTGLETATVPRFSASDVAFLARRHLYAVTTSSGGVSVRGHEDVLVRLGLSIGDAIGPEADLLAMAEAVIADEANALYNRVTGAPA